LRVSEFQIGAEKLLAVAFENEAENLAVELGDATTNRSHPCLPRAGDRWRYGSPHEPRVAVVLNSQRLVAVDFVLTVPVANDAPYDLNSRVRGY
jgi:hypothetical protein